MGSSTNSSSEGNTSQKMPPASAATFCASPVSRYSQTKASTEVSGSEARAAAQKVLRLATSATATMISADSAILSAYWPMAADSALAPHLREQDDVADRGRVGQQHHQAVDPDAAAAGGRQAVFERADEVGVVVHRLLVAGLLLPHLFHEALGLVLGVVELGET